MLSFILSFIVSLSLYNNTIPAQPVEIHKEVPILMYHEIGEPEGPWGNLYVSEENFTKQMDWLNSQGYTTISMRDLEKNRQGVLRLPAKPVIVTFDDGYASMYDFVFPLMKDKGLSGTFYLYPDKFSTWNSLLPEQVREMSAEKMEIGSHSKSHADMTKISRERLIKELVESKRILEDITGKKIESFCYPAGRYSPVVIEELKNAGYKSAVTTKYGFYNSNESIYEIKRIRINYTDSLESFAKKLK